MDLLQISCRRKGKMVGKRLKQNGHPVPRKGIRFICKGKPYPKEACDVRTYYSTILPLSSNQNCKTVSSFRYQRGSSPCRTRQTVSSHLSLLREKSHCNSQLDPTHDKGSEPGCHTGVDNLSLSEALLYALPPYQHRKFRSVSSLFTGDPSSGALHPSAMSVHDGKRCCQTCETGLENR